jgi:hypothetical protein
LIRLLRCGFVGAAALLFVARSGAQSSTGETPEANPGRPTVSTPATLSPVGYLQFEKGGLYAETSPEFTTLFGINQVTKLTGASRLHLLALSEPLVQASGATGDALSGSRPGEVFAGFQAVVLSGEGHKPTVSLSYIRRLYASPAPEIDIGTFRNSALILLSDDLAGFHFDINGIFSEQTKGLVRRGQFGQTLSISHRLGRLTIAGELWHFTQPLTSGNAVGNCAPSRMRSEKLLWWMPDSIMASPLPQRSGKGLRASRIFCLTDCGDSTIENKSDAGPTVSCTCNEVAAPI